MPLFDFQCPSCGYTFEELVVNSQAKPPCPKCGQKEVSSCVSAPSPLKTGAFPYKVGKPIPRVSRPSGGCPGKNGIS